MYLHLGGERYSLVAQPILNQRFEVECQSLCHHGQYPHYVELTSECRYMHGDLVVRPVQSFSSQQILVESQVPVRQNLGNGANKQSLMLNLATVERVSGVLPGNNMYESIWAERLTLKVSTPFQKVEGLQGIKAAKGKVSKFAQVTFFVSKCVSCCWCHHGHHTRRATSASPCSLTTVALWRFWAFDTGVELCQLSTLFWSFQHYEINSFGVHGIFQDHIAVAGFLSFQLDEPVQ